MMFTRSHRLAVRLLLVLGATFAWMAGPVSAGETVRRTGKTSARRGELAGVKGWLCAAARRCPRREQLRKLVAAEPSQLSSAHAAELHAIGSALLAELARMLREVCGHSGCSKVARGLLRHVGTLRRSRWKPTDVRRDTVGETYCGKLTGWRARLRDKSGRELDLFCGLDAGGEPSCLVELALGSRSYRYHSSATKPAHTMLELVVAGDKGFMWMDPGMTSVGGVLAK